MCEQCVAQTVLYGEVVPGFYLVRATVDGGTMKAGDWGLVECNDPFFIWSGEIIADPTEGMTDEEMNAIDNDDAVHNALEDRFTDGFEPIRFMDTPVSVGWRLIHGAIAQGYDPHPEKDAPPLAADFPYWLWKRMVMVVEAYGNGEEKTP